jgi:hypothetical protein
VWRYLYICSSNKEIAAVIYTAETPNLSNLSVGGWADRSKAL